MAHEREPLIETGKDNTRQLAQALSVHSNMERFLRDDQIRVHIRPTNASKIEQTTLLGYNYDIDGMVVELEHLSGISAPIHYIHLVPNKKNIQPAYHLLKKHVNMREYTDIGPLKNAQALHLCHVEGFRISICVLPPPGSNTPGFSNKSDAITTTHFFLERVKAKFVDILTSLCKEDIDRPTIQKNSLHDISNYNVLHQDQTFILSCLDTAVRHSSAGAYPMIKLVATQFGQKSAASVTMSTVFNADCISAISVHHAVNISASDYYTHMLWSRQGIQEVINERGTIFSALSFFDAVNFQTNLDHRAIDISNELRQVAKYPTQITFIQLYADTPHYRGDLHPHPVSGIIACCKLLHPRTNMVMHRNAANYLQSMRENTAKLSRNIPCRLEVVTKLFPHQIPPSFASLDLFSEDALHLMCEKYPMFVPFYDCVEDVDAPSFTKIIQSLASHVNSELSTLYEQNQHCGGYMPTWNAYQMELCAEKLFHGRPFVPTDNTLSINLGPGAIHDQRSVTNMRGILGISPANSASLPDSPPPLTHWTHSVNQQGRIKRLFTFSDTLAASHVVIGRALITNLIGDLYNSDCVSLESFKLDAPAFPLQCSGSISLEQLAQELRIRSRFPFPFTFGRALEMMEGRGLDVIRVVKAGVIELNLTHFPALKFRDESHHQRAQWNKKAVWQIVVPGGQETVVAKAATMTADVLVSLETKKLTFSRNLTVFRDSGMPWMVPVVSRLQHLNLDWARVKEICVFVSAIALMQQGVYVDYTRLSYVEMELALQQKCLQRLEILSNSLIAGIHRLKVYRLHERIPYKVPNTHSLGNPMSSSRQSFTAAAPIQTEEENTPSITLDESGVQQDVQFMDIRNLPANYRRRWSARELDLLHVAHHEAISSGTIPYIVYTRLCQDNQIPTRSRMAFEHKLKRVSGIP